jgi:hypothetical protein
MDAFALEYLGNRVDRSHWVLRVNVVPPRVQRAPLGHHTIPAPLRQMSS